MEKLKYDERTFVNDIETLADVCLVSYEAYDTNTKIVFEFSRRKNDYIQFRHFFMSNIDYCITFNGIDFDDQICNWLAQQKFDRLNGVQIAQQVYKVAQALTGDEYEPKKPYSKFKYNLPYQQIDLYKYWSKMLRLSKKLSLKLFAVNLDLNVEEMPIHHSTTNLTDEEIDMVISYNLNDIEVTKSLAIELKEEINLRIDIQEEFGLPCLSWDTIKIGSELLLDLYCKEVYYKSKHIQNIIKFDDYKSQVRNTIPVEQSTIYFKNILPEVNFKTDFFKQVYFDMKVSVDTYGKEYVYINPDGSRLKLTFSVGGLHSVNKNESYSLNKLNNESIETIDVGSLYPTLYIVYGYFHAKYKEVLQKITYSIRDKRFQAKKNKDLVKDKVYKLLLNGVSGLLQNDYSWLRSPQSAIGMRLHGQLILARTIEELGLAKIKVISANTDGIEAIVKPEQQEVFSNIQRLIEKEFNLLYEQDSYKLINYKTVSDYIAITTKGKIKTKGEFSWQDEKRPGKKTLDGANEFLVIAKAVEAYYKDNISIEEFINKHDNIYDFTAAKRVDKKYEVIYRGETQQQLNRYFVTTKSKGAYLYKRRKKALQKKKHITHDDQFSLFNEHKLEETKGNLENVLKDTAIYILNKRADKLIAEYPIWKEWYITKAKAIVNIFENNQQKLD